MEDCSNVLVAVLEDLLDEAVTIRQLANGLHNKLREARREILVADKTKLDKELREEMETSKGH